MTGAPVRRRGADPHGRRSRGRTAAALRPPPRRAAPGGDRARARARPRRPHAARPRGRGRRQPRDARAPLRDPRRAHRGDRGARARRDVLLPDLVAGAEDPLRALWARATAPEGRRHVRLFVAITGRSMHGDPPFADAVARSLRDRTALVAGALEAAGRPSAEASAAATVILGVMRGLMVDLLLTGDSARVDAAFAAFVAGQARAAG
ncbi:hypothetical protein WDV94_13600 [Clavibacter tessellarius]